jgi:hypothetical protein
MKVSKSILEEILKEELGLLPEADPPIQPQQTKLHPPEHGLIDPDDTEAFKTYVEFWEGIASVLESISGEMQAVSSGIQTKYKELLGIIGEVKSDIDFFRQKYPGIMRYDLLKEPVVELGILAKTLSEFAGKTKKLKSTLQQIKTIQGK